MENKNQKNRKTQKIVISLCLLRYCLLRVLWCSVCLCTAHFVVVPINLTCPHCLQHSLNIFSIYIVTSYIWLRQKYTKTPELIIKSTESNADHNSHNSLNASDVWSIVFTKFLIRPSLMWSEGKYTFCGSTSAGCFTLCFPILCSLRSGQFLTL